MAQSISEQPEETAFDKGIANFTWLMLRFVLVMVPLVFVINGLTKGAMDVLCTDTTGTLTMDQVILE